MLAGVTFFTRLLLLQQGQVTSAFLSAISFKNAVNVWPQFLHNTSIVGSSIVSYPVALMGLNMVDDLPYWMLQAH
ncbi:MAG TPA: hypothetical protein VN777_11150 [Terriglobales bacterium]|nr:hypothetical protein [Terriglobales bacterium]